MNGKRPNIVILNPDQMRADTLSHLGNPASITPVLDNLTNEGVSFSNAYCQNPVCTPSRCSFMSGWYPHVAGHRTMTHMLREHEPVLLKELKDNGYQVWMNERNDLIPADHMNYYEDYCTTFFQVKEKPKTLETSIKRGEPGSKHYYSFYRGELEEGMDLDDLWTKGAVDFIDGFESEEPFCLFLPWMNPHPEYMVKEPYYSRIDRDKLEARILPPEGYEGKPRIQKELNRIQNMDAFTEDDYRELRAVYLGMCSKVDDMVGQVIDALKRNGLYDNTAIFFFSDHGDYTGDYGIVEKAQNCFEDCLVNVPFIVKLPKGMQKRTGISDELIELIDFYGTVEDLVGFEPSHTHFGHSLIDFMALRENKLRFSVHCEGGFRKGEEHCKESGGSGTPISSSLYYPRQYLQYSDEMYNGKAIMHRTKDYKYIRRLYEKDEFYDLKKDPSEIHNLIDSKEYAEIINSMKEGLLEHYMDTCDVVPYKKDSRMGPNFKKIMMNQ